MQRIILNLTTVALLAFSGFLSSAAQAQGPYGSHRGYASPPRVVIYSGGGGYGGGYGNGYGGGYAPYMAPYYPRSVPYGAGYSSGYQPYQEMYLQRLYYGLGN
jgi:hypothetical protein